MPHFAFFAFDKPGMEAVRSRVREKHRAYIRQAQADCRCVAGGPLLADDQGRMAGTLLIFDATDRDAVVRFMAGDPYGRESLFARTEIWGWRWGLGQPPDAATLFANHKGTGS